MRGKREAAEAAARAALRASRPQDETFVMNFADKARIDVPLTSDVAALAAGVGRRDSIGGTALRDAIAQAQDYLVANAARPRKALLVITDGHDNASAISRERLKELTAEHEVAVFAIGIARPDDPEGARRGRDALEEVAESSGGLVHQVSTGAEAEGRGLQAAEQMRHFYTIGYAPTEQAVDGTYRKLRVVVKGQERLRVQTRAGYRATPAGAKTQEPRRM